ncbi:trimethylamine methyltransferase [Desulfonema ishimotonii]|uniref:Methyltransferase n=1 Tax=Desulfonema ishimotonii TaxID=45657 RepID=A0A401FZ80_9BACT|nr:trimethylamine methyltransferase family protein [Desulfonema ishimotonii]GBC62257.1 trimethylamine methyltransferase [Desulfonema ishimotonii]
MYDRMQALTQEQMTKIHDASMDLLQNVGIAFNEDEALEIFKSNGFRVDGKIVFFTEEQVRKALETAPSRFTVTARNPEKSVAIGEDDFVFVPGYGAPFIALPDGEQREATMQDYDNFCKLVQTSKSIDMNGFMMVEPSDVPPETAHLDMIFSSIALCDKPFMGSPVSKQGAKDCVDMAAIVWGGMDKLREVGPVTVSLINSLSPLQYSDEMAGSLIELARANQACVLASLIMAGSSGPVTLAGVTALQNAEILAGITLAQLVNAGAPVIYGSTSSAMDMKTGGLSIGCPELSAMISLTAQMARFYNLPSRSGGGLTDAHTADGQAGAESTLALTTAARNGVNFMLHSAGILGSYIAMSYEKYLLDEEVCGIIRKLVKHVEVTDESIDVEMIKTVGIGGQYLTQPKTFQLCRTEFHLTDFMNRQNHAGWKAAGSKGIDQFATDRLSQRLAAYEKPEIDPAIEDALSAFVSKRKNG